uniref:BTB domain-containing protein n=1 Tax=Panagrellus redivivus TaxID=6233 RepID=A0A7E4UXT4_PANRE
MKTINHQRRKCYNDIYITDNQHIHDVAINESMFHLDFLFNFSFVNYFHDGPLTIDPHWHTAFLVNDMVDLNRAFFVKHTLILYLKSDKSYDRVMPFIAGSYSRLILYGQFTWTQVEHLIHDKVKKVRIMGKIDVKPSDYDVVVKFMLRFCCGFDYKFSIHDECFPSSLMEKLKKATENHETYSLVDRGNELQHFIHEKNPFFLFCKLTRAVYESLAATINQSVAVVKSYEADLVLHNGVVLGKLERTLHVKLRGDDIGTPLAPVPAKY